MSNYAKEEIENIFTRNVPGIRDILVTKTIGLAGCGGLGSNAAAALVRAGIGKLIIADFDRVEPSNLNRQFYFLSDIGKEKTTALTAHLKAINPQVEIIAHALRLTPQNTPPIFKDADLLIEAFDRAENKAWLIETWCLHFPTKPVVCGSGISGYGQTETLKVRRAGKIVLCGDETTDMSMGLVSARVAMVANMQANEAIALLINQGNLRKS